MPGSRETSLEGLLGSIKDAGERRAQPAAARQREPEEEYASFGHGRVGRRPQMMIEFRRSDGSVEAFPYSMLSRISSDDPGQRFTLTFGAVKVEVEGERLEKLLDYVLEHRAGRICEADRAARFQSAADEGVVTRLGIFDSAATLVSEGRSRRGNELDEACA